MKTNIIDEYYKSHKNDRNEWERCYIHEKIFDSVRECIAIYKAEDDGNDFIIVDFNSSAELTENKHRDDIIGKSILDVFPQYRESGLIDVFRKVYETGKPEEYPVKYSSDKRITAGWRDNYIFKIAEDDMIVTIYEDVSKLKKAEESLRESEEKYKVLFENTPTGYQSLDEDAYIREINKTWLKTLGYSREEVTGRWFGEFISINDTDKFRKLFDAFKQNGEIQNEEIRMRKKNGEEIVVSLTGRIRYDSKGVFKQTHTILQDITEHKKMQDDIFNISKFAAEDPYPVMRVDSEYNITYANEGSNNLLNSWKTSTGGKIPNEFYENVNLALKRGKHTLIDVQCNDITYSLVLAPIKEGNYVNIYGRDITLRKRYEENLSSVNRMYAFLSQMNQLIIRTNDRDELFESICKIAVDYGKFRFAWIGKVDYQAQKIVPYKFAGIEAGYLKNIFISIREDLPEGKGPTGRAVREMKCITANNIIDDPAYAPWRSEALERGYRSAATVPFNQDDKVYGVLCFTAPEPDFFSNEEVRLLEEISSDLSFTLKQMRIKEEKENIRKELVESNERFRIISEVAPFPISVFDSSNNYFYINPKFTEVFGYTLDEIPTLEKWFEVAYPDPEYRSLFFKEWSKMDIRKHELEPKLFNVRCRDGKLKSILFHYYPLDKNTTLLYYMDVTIIPWQIPIQ